LDLVDRSPLGVADRAAFLFVGFRDVLGDCEGESLVALDLLGRRLLLEERNRLPDPFEALLVGLLGRVEARRVRLVGDERVE
jgi:hypothetical protein